MKHVVVVPYINQDEVERLLKIGAYLSEHNNNACDYEFLLVSKCAVKSSHTLINLFSSIAPTKQFQPESIFNTYPEGVDECFWQSMEYVYKNYDQDGGFVLWLESDMIPISSDRMDRLNREWLRHHEVVVMGLFNPRKFYYRQKTWVDEHINGGACYSKEVTRIISPELREKYFDTDIFRHLKKDKKYHKSNLFKFAHQYSILDEVIIGHAVILHGYLQDKNNFISKTIDLMSSADAREMERESIDMLPWRHRVCCAKAVPFLFSMNCPVHENNNLFSKFKNRLFYILYRIREWVKTSIT